MANYVFGQPALPSFAEFAVGPNIARPIQRENSTLHVAEKDECEALARDLRPHLMVKAEHVKRVLDY